MSTGKAGVVVCLLGEVRRNRMLFQFHCSRHDACPVGSVYHAQHWSDPVIAQVSVQAGATLAETADSMSELSFPASDPPGAMAEEGVHMDASVLHRPVPGTPAIRRLLIEGLQAEVS